MADQNTTVAQLPAGYATLAGVIYAVAATSPKGWNYCVWTRISACLTPDPTTNNTVQSASQRSGRSSNTELGEICYRLSRQITKHARSLRKASDNDFTETVALLHLLCSFPDTQTLTVQHGSVHQDLESAPSSSNASNTTVAILNSANKNLSPQISPMTANGNAESFKSITVKVHGAKGVTQGEPVLLSTAKVNQILTQEKAGCINLVGDSELIERLVEHSHRQDFNPSVSVQMAAPFEAFVTEVVFKGIEILLACGVILGSSGGAWLGLTLASMFPQRISAGLYSSAYGQKLSRNQVIGLQGVYLWRSAGTVWNDSKPHSYELLPCSYLGDKWRDAIGYIIQYAGLFVVQLYKLQLRTSLEFGEYNITRDAIRYILLVIQFFVFLLYFFLIRRSRSIRGENRQNRSNPHRDFIAGVIYTIAQCAGIVCVILGQKEFLKPIWKFYLTSKIIDPIAAVGCVAVMTLGQQRGMKVSVEKWVLMWSLGACTVIW